MKIYTEAETPDVITYQVSLNNDHDRRILTSRRELRRIEDIIHIKNIIPNAKNVLCIGARDDSEVMTFIKAGYDAVGIDVCTSTPLIKKMPASELKDIGKWDIIYCSHVLEHMSSPLESLKAIRSIANGIIFIILPIVNRDPDIEHPTVYDIMNYYPETNFKNFPRAWNDFETFQPYELKYSWYRNGLTEEYEVAFIMEVK